MIVPFLSRHWRTALMSCALLGIAIFMACELDIVRVSSISMEDTLHDGDFVVMARTRLALGEKWARWLTPSRRQIIVFCLPNDSRTIMIKRTIGVPGDLIRIYRGNLIVGGTKIEEPYVHHEHEYNPDTNFWPMDAEDPGLRSILMPPRHYFVLGDNRERSVDSRAFGPVPENDVLGVVLFAIHRRGEKRNLQNIKNGVRLP